MRMGSARSRYSRRVPNLFAIALMVLAMVAFRPQEPTSKKTATAAEPARATATPAAAATGGEAARPEGERRRARRGAEFETAELALDADRKIELRFDQVPTTDAAYAGIQSPIDGQVVPFIKSRPLKLKTPVDLRFGETVIAAHNQGPDYPGVYSLWLKNAGGGWRLVFNDFADVWGTQHDPAADRAEVPLEVATAAEPVETFTAKLEPAEGGGILRLAWGSTEWSAPFKVE
jgi:DUF2911 family protein